MKTIKNHAASVKNKLREIAKSEGKSHQLLLIRYFQERLLFRVSQSPFKRKFCLKGGALLYALQEDKGRVTKDLDFLGLNLKSNISSLKNIFTIISKIPFPQDGVVFDPASIEGSEITKDGKYHGIRLGIFGYLEKTRQRLQIDIGFGDVVTSGPVEIIYPVILDLPPPSLFSYNIETIIAEKFEAMIDLSETNTRMKDFYDVYYLIKNHQLDPQVLENAINNTFKHRNTPTPPNHLLFEPNFYLDENRKTLWYSWLNKMTLDTTIDFSKVMQDICEVLFPIYQNMSKNADASSTYSNPN